MYFLDMGYIIDYIIELGEDADFNISFLYYEVSSRSLKIIYRLGRDETLESENFQIMVDCGTMFSRWLLIMEINGVRQIFVSATENFHRKKISS